MSSFKKKDAAEIQQRLKAHKKQYTDTNSGVSQLLAEGVLKPTAGFHQRKNVLTNQISKYGFGSKNPNGVPKELKRTSYRGIIQTYGTGNQFVISAWENEDGSLRVEVTEFWTPDSPYQSAPNNPSSSGNNFFTI